MFDLRRLLFVIIKWLDPRVSEDTEALRKHIFSTYKWMRIGMLVIALAFPLALWLVGGWRYGLQLQDSMSAYYWAAPIEKGEEGGDAPMRVVFVGLLFALGCCLFLYKGYTLFEDLVLNVAAFCAIVVALVPMCPNAVPNAVSVSVSECPSWHRWHSISAIVFFVLLAVVAVIHGLYALRVLRSGPDLGLEDRPAENRLSPLRIRLLRFLRVEESVTWESFIYAALYVVAAAVMVLAPVLTWLVFEGNPAQTFWAEVAGIGAFCIFWGVQIVQILRRDFDQRLAEPLAQPEANPPSAHVERL